MIDHFAQRRMELQQQNDDSDQAQANLDRQLARDKEREDYGRRKEDIAEKKVDADASFKRAQATQASLKEAKAAIAAGRHPGTMLVQGPDGQPAYVDWKYVGGEQPQPSPAQPTAPPQAASPPPAEAPPAQQPDPELEALMNRAAQQEAQSATPQQGSPPAPDNSIFLDRNDEGTATALSGPEGQTQQQLPIQAFPPGAKEGQTFNPADVNLRGGKGNPFAEPIATSPGASAPPELGNNSLPNSGTVFIPPRDIRGMSMAPQPSPGGGGRWEARLPDGHVITVDPQEARAAKRDQDAQDLRDLDVILASPDTKLNPQLFQFAVIKKQAILGGMSPSDIKNVYGQAGKVELQGNRIASNEGMQANRLATQEKIAADSNATRRATSKYGHGGAGKTIVQSSGNGSAFSQLKPTEQSRIENAVNNGVNMLDREMNWTKLEGIGFDRLNLALQNIRAKGDLGGAQQMEAMMNFFGYIRGGVPAKNETDEFKSVTSNLGTMLDKLGQKVGVSELWTHFTGSQEDRDAIAKIAQLPAGQRAGLEQAIIESQKAIQGMATKNIAAQAEAYKSAGVPFHERMQDKINSKLRFIGAQPRQWFSDSPLIPDFNGSSGGASPASGGKLSDQQLLDALKGMK